MALTQKIVPNLWFDGNAKEAVEFYVSIFPDGEITGTSYYPTKGLADFQQSLAGKELTVDFTLAGQCFTAINAGPEFKFNEAVSLSVQCEDQTEIDYFWDKLSAVPQAEQCGWCKDRYGLSWQIVPKDIDRLIQGPHGSTEPRAFQAMMRMKKIDITTLKGTGTP